MRSTLLCLALAAMLVPGLLVAEQPEVDSYQLVAGPSNLPQISGETLPAVTNLVVRRPLPGAVEGTYRFDDFQLHFQAHRLGKEAADVRFWSEDGSFQLESRLLSRTQGWIRYGGVQISGRGEVDEEGQQMIAEILDSPFGRQLPRLSLEMGCRLTHRREAPVLAAFVQPWQILFKLSGSLVVDTGALRLSPGCSYGASAAGRVLVLREGEPMAYVPFFNTLDAVGAAHQALSPKSTAPCGAMCRGACGADCSSPLCTPGSSGCDYTCPTHPFCQWHDACYDGCNAMYGCLSTAGWTCKRAVCDEQCLAQYGLDTCLEWAAGFGPSTGVLTFDECDDCGGGGGQLQYLQVVRQPGVTVTEMNLRDALAPGPIAGALEASQAPAAAAGLEQPETAPRRWRPLGPNAVYSFACDSGGGGGGGGGGDPCQTATVGSDGFLSFDCGGGSYCTYCTCTGDTTSWEGEICGSSNEELVDACWSSCY